MQTSREKIKSDFESILDTLLAPAPGISCSEASQRLSSICADHLKACAQSSAQPTAASGEDEDQEDGYYGNSTPGVPGFFLSLWSSVIERVQNTPVEEPAHHDYISRLVDFIGKTKENPQTNGDKWVVGDEECGWKDLPLLGQTIRDVYNEPIDTMAFNSSLLLSPEGQAAIAGASQIDDQNSESDTARLAQARHRWLSLQSFISCLWRDCGCDSYALYAIWAIRPALEDWPNSPPLRDTKCDTLEESPAYLALQVEAAAIWLCNTAPLMYKCTEIWGPNGNVDWPKRAGAPGKGGERWDGVDGYDREHKRWELWKDVLGEVVRWCDGMNKDIQGWKVKDAAGRALEAMKAAER